MIVRVARRGATVGLSLDQVTGTTGARQGRSKALYVPLAAVVAIAAIVALILLLVAGPATQPTGRALTFGSLDQPAHGARRLDVLTLPVGRRRTPDGRSALRHGIHLLCVRVGGRVGWAGRSPATAACPGTRWRLCQGGGT